jgi:hypothetical protein
MGQVLTGGAGKILQDRLVLELDYQIMCQLLLLTKYVGLG